MIKSLIRTYVPEIIYGANDGIVTTLAVIAGVTGAELSTQIILILGFANLFADGVSMGASNVLSERSKREERPSLRAASRTGLATFAGFVTAGFIPLLAYLLPWFSGPRFWIAAALAGLTLFGVGAARALFTNRNWLRAGLEMLLIGSGAAAIAYSVGVLGASITS